VLPVVATPSADFSENLVNHERDLGRNGSFLVIRQLEQNVEAFWNYCETEGSRLAHSKQFPYGMRRPAAEYVAAKIVGRWRDGSPLVRYPRWPAEYSPWPSRPLMRSGTGTGAAVQTQVSAPIPASSAAIRPERQARTRRSAGGPPAAAAAQAAVFGLAKGGTARPKPAPPFEPDNDFLFGAEDAQGLRCPFGAHIRRANPRESFDPGSREQIAISNRHRIIRIGRFYEPQQGQNKGLFFMCLNGDLERQFEFVQQTWVQNSSFHGLASERDPLIGQRQNADGYSIPTNDGPIRLAKLPEFVNVLGGGYFFLPGQRTLRFLAS
jgi:deferrochelatase/peroxidase EfeB